MADSTYGSGSMGNTQLLRRRKDDSPFNFATKTLGTLKDNIENVTKKVSIDNIASQVAQSKKREEKKFRAAPVGVTQSFSVVLTHILAPLWSVGLRQPPKEELSAQRVAELRARRMLNLNENRFVDFARRLDNMGIDIDKHIEFLQVDEQLTTAFIIMLLAKLMCVENGEYLAPSYLALLDQVSRDTKILSDQVEDHPNDEIAAHDQVKRKLTEVGGTWTPPGAVELGPQAHAVRHRVLLTALAASVCFKYVYNEDHLQSLCDSLARQLFLLNYSESIVQLVSGVKGPQYVAKYLLMATPEQPSLYLKGSLETPDVGVSSLALQETTSFAMIALQNFIHRNDTSDIIVTAMSKAITVAPEDCRPALFAFCSEILHQIYCVDLRLLAHVMDATRPFILHKSPVGTHALRFITHLSDLMRNAVSLPRRQLSSVFVAGKELRSFRLQPVHVLTTPYCARAPHFIASLNLSPIGLSRRLSAPMVPTFGKSLGSVNFSGGRNSATTNNKNQQSHLGITNDSSLNEGGASSSSDQHYYVDDSTLYIANQCINIFQALFELSDGNGRVESMDLNQLFSIPPSTLCRFYPTLHNLLQQAVGLQQPATSNPGGSANGTSSSQTALNNSSITSASGMIVDPNTGRRYATTTSNLNIRQGGLTVASRTPPALVEKIHDMFLTIMDQCAPERGQKKFRLESPWEPFLPTFINVCTEADDMTETIKHIMERHWKYCDQRITERDSGAAYLHPQRDLSLSHFIETEIKLAVAGGGGMLRHVVGSILQLQNLFPGSLLKPKIYCLPFGYENSLCGWLGLRDPIYAARVLSPLLSVASPTTDAPSVEAMLNTGAAGAEGNNTGSNNNQGAILKGPPSSIKSFVLRNAINDYLLHATEENKIIIYQAECTYPDGSTALVPFCCNLEIGTHVNNAVRADPIAVNMLKTASDQSNFSFVGGNPNASMATAPTTSVMGGVNNSNANNNSSFVANAAYNANSFVGSMAKSFLNGVTALSFADNNSGASSNTLSNNQNQFANGGNRGNKDTITSSVPGPLLNLSAMIFLGSGRSGKSERVDRILISLHGNRGPRLATLKGFSGQEIRHSVVGRDLLDWVSTTYHVFASEEAFSAAQSLVDAGLFILASASPNTDIMKFNEKSIYTLCPRELNDSQPLAAPCSRGIVSANAKQLLRRYLDSIAVKEGYFNADGSNSAAGGDAQGSSPTLLTSMSVGIMGGGNQPAAGGLGGGSGAGGTFGGFQSAGNATAVPTMRCRVAFSGRKGDLRYIDIDENIALENAVDGLNSADGSPNAKGNRDGGSTSSTLLRDIVSIRLRSTGSSGDMGSAPNPTVPTLHMAILQPDRKKLSSGAYTNNNNGNNNRNGRDVSELFDHYQLTYGDRRANPNAPCGPSDVSPASPSGSPKSDASPSSPTIVPPPALASAVMVDPNVVLTIEHTRPPTGGRGASNTAASVGNNQDAGLILSADGDLFGPFVTVKVKPVTINLNRGGGNRIADPLAHKPAATVSVMSYMQIPGALDGSM